ncbi:hypothetical protein NFI95_03070 [Acetobacteraceae bacterium KSS8]|uniref:Uncharacterized protein n=1 Tax=Endosaccharibacter trunci TaxID=2812733 RepID=A0ABT1W3J5_9PROT|nr:hypothetical protein [Acetobacteraceae bacterium KSS8]
MRFPVFACTAGLVAALSLGGCSSSFGSGGGSSPGKTYVVMPSGETVPVQTTTRPPG